MTLDEARSPSVAQPAPPPAAAASGVAHERVSFRGGERIMVADRHAPAARRRPRDEEALASRLARRYGLPSPAAREVATRRLPLDIAVAAAREAGRPAAAPGSSLQRFLIPALAFLLAVSLIAVHTWIEWQHHATRPPESEPHPARRPTKDTLVARPGAGAAPRPRGHAAPASATAVAALERYCAEAAAEPCEPVELAPLVPGRDDRYMGLFSDDSDRLFAVRLWREPVSGGWFAGEPTGRVIVRPAESVALSGPRIPLTARSAR
jgi:hypothetical protein